MCISRSAAVVTVHGLCVWELTLNLPIMGPTPFESVGNPAPLRRSSRHLPCGQVVNRNGSIEKGRHCFDIAWLTRYNLHAQNLMSEKSRVEGALSPFTCQILADITGRTIETVGNTQEVGAVGSALVVAAGIKGEDVLELSRKLVKIKHVYKPNAANKEIYERSYGVFKKLYRSNARNFKALNS